jgi:hypothetical protein
MNEPIYLVAQIEEISKINNDLNSTERLDLFKKVLRLKRTYLLKFIFIKNFEISFFSS